MPSREFDDKMKENNNNTTIIMEGKFARIEMNATTKKIRSVVYCQSLATAVTVTKSSQV